MPHAFEQRDLEEQEQTTELTEREQATEPIEREQATEPTEPTEPKVFKCRLLRLRSSFNLVEGLSPDEICEGKPVVYGGWTREPPRTSRKRTYEKRMDKPLHPEPPPRKRSYRPSQVEWRELVREYWQQ